MSDDKLQFVTLAVRRVLPSEHVERSPVVSPAIVSYGPDDHTIGELQLALSELVDEARPTTVARLLLPDGVRLEHIEVEVGRPALPGRLGRMQAVTIAIVIVPEPRAVIASEPGAPPTPPLPAAGHWVFVPVLDHACYVARGEDLVARVTAELARLPAALSLDVDGWRRLFSVGPVSLEPIEIELATTPLSVAKGRRALADAERRRLAFATLDGAGRMLTAPRWAPPLVGRDALVVELGRTLSGRARRSVVLVGDEAAGKSALALAWVTANPGRPVYATSASELIAGATGLGEWQARVAAVLAAADTLDAVLVFDDFGALFADRPDAGGVDLAGALRRHVVDGRVRVVGELTPAALDRAERRDVSLLGAMLRITVPPTDEPTTIAACRAWAEYWARTEPSRPQIAPAMVPTAVDLARRYLPYRAFPGKAVRVLEELRVAHDAARDAAGVGAVLGDSELYAAFASSTGVPLALLADDRALAKADVIAALRRRMIGQDTAVERVAEAVCVAKARLAPADKPLASLLFVGPTGTGKTELARSIAAYLFGAPDRMVRLDMSEYTDPYAAERLFGGGGGADAQNADEGRLTAAVRSQPFGVVLLDEIEKAHASVFDLLLQVLGEARLTDGRGRTTMFHNSIIVLTSNLGTRSARGTLGLRGTSASGDAERDREERRYRDAVVDAFRPELINRLDQIVVFQPLVPAEIAAVAEIAVGRLAERRGLTQAGVLLDVSPAALAAIAEAGFSAELGARALRRHVDTALLAPAARVLARAGAEAQGGTLTVRTVDEPTTRAPGSRLGEIRTGELVVALWRRAAATGRRLVRSALALGGLRRDSDRELALPAALAVRDRLAELEATIATAGRKQTSGNDPTAAARTALPGHEIARLSTEYARLRDRWAACTGVQGDLRTAEELCLEALAKDLDAVELIDAAVLQRQQFRRELFWLVTALRAQRPGATLLVHSPDSRAATVAWLRLMLAAAEARGWRAQVHLWGNPSANGNPWGAAYDRGWCEANLAGRAPVAALIRISGVGADVLFGLEAGLHQLHGLGAQPSHVWIEALEPKADFTDAEWFRLPGPPTPRTPRGQPMRQVTIDGDRVVVDGDELEIPYAELAARLEECAVVRVLAAFVKQKADDNADVGTLWTWSHPLAAAALAAGKTP